MLARLCRPVAREIWRELSVSKMSQRSITSFFKKGGSSVVQPSQKASNGLVAAAQKSVIVTSPVKQERKRVSRVLSDSEEEPNDEPAKVGETLPSDEKIEAGVDDASLTSAKSSTQKHTVNGAKHLKRKASPSTPSSSKRPKVEARKSIKTKSEEKTFTNGDNASSDAEVMAVDVEDSADPEENNMDVPAEESEEAPPPKKEPLNSNVVESVGKRSRKTPSKAAVVVKGKKDKQTKVVKEKAGSSKVDIKKKASAKESDGSEADEKDGNNEESKEEKKNDVAEKKTAKKPTGQGKKGRSKTPSRRKSSTTAKKGAATGKKVSDTGKQSGEQIEDNSDTPATKKVSSKKTPKSKEIKSSEKEGDAKDETGAPEKGKSKNTNEKEKNTSPNTSVDKSDSPASDGRPSPLNYNSNRLKYHPIDDACWERGEKVPYIALAKTLDAIENTSARLKRIEILSNLLRSVLVLTPEDLIPCVYLCLNKLAPAYEGVELGIGDMVLMKAVAQSTGRTLAKLRAEVASKGDLGLVAEASRSNQMMMFKPAPLTIRGVFAKLLEIARMTGNASIVKKGDKIQSMFVACRGCETRYLIRSLGGKLRIGLAEQSVLAAIAQAAVLTPPCQDFPPEIINSSKSMSPDKYKKKLEEAALIVKTTYCECPSYDKILGVLLKEGVAALPENCHITPGIPMKPMLAHPTKGVSEVLHRFDKAKFTCEFKYDGERAQIHLLDNGEVHIYSRNQENNTSKYPDVIGRLPRALKEGAKTCILDSEMVAWDAEKKQILPFQVLSTRKRKDANEAEIKVQVCIYAFDLLYLNDESLVKKPFGERRQALHDAFVEVEGEFTFVKSMDADNTEKIEEFLEESIKGNCEGLMVKTLDVDATYEIAKRSHNWLKLKKDYLDGVGDTLDLVVIGGYHGKGKRTGSYGGFLLACYDEANEEFQSICKLGTGFKDEDLDKHSKFFQEHIIEAPKSYYRYDNTLAPDVWFDAVQVWEIKCADLSVSPVHKAALGLVDETKGISLRFPRFLRIREDKSPEAATNADQVAALYNNQEQIKNRQSANAATEEEDEEY